MVVAGMPPWPLVPPWAGSVSPGVGVSGTGSALGGFASHHCVVWDVLGLSCSAGVNPELAWTLSFQGSPVHFGAITPLSSFGAPRCFGSCTEALVEPPNGTFYPGILLLPCVFIHCPQLEAPVLALSIK